MSPTCGSASITTPGSPPFTPASHEPSVPTSTPFAYCLASSPKYQTLPCLSWAYQSWVSSSSPPFTNTVSITSTQVTPMRTLVEWVTSTILSSSPASVTPL